MNGLNASGGFIFGEHLGAVPYLSLGLRDIPLVLSIFIRAAEQEIHNDNDNNNNVDSKRYPGSRLSYSSASTGSCICKLYLHVRRLSNVGVCVCIPTDGVHVLFEV